MSSIDERVVSMKFNNSQFQKGVQDTTKSLDDLKKGLNLSGATKGIQDLDAAGRKFSLAGMSQGIDGLSTKFVALATIGIAAISNIANRAVNAGMTMAKALTVDPIKSGLQEYELQLNSIQTILANTQSKGSTLTDVNAALAELNTYADKTIYNFSEMSRNIGTFTAAGVDLETSTSAIKGIANLAALSGSNSQQASTAMYQLSQALSSGTVKLMDWNSVVNAGMGGQVFQDALKETARAHGVGVDAMVEKNGSFRESLQEGWLSAEIMTETLSKLTGDLTDEQLRSMGYTDEQIVGIQEMARTASDAATKVKTFTQLIDTLKEAAGSGWAQTWQILLGDFEEAKVLFTEASNLFGGMLGRSADARNSMLQGWKDLGGRTAAIESIRNVIMAVTNTLGALTKGFRNIFPPMTSQQLFDITKGFQRFTEALLPGQNTMRQLQVISRGVFAVLDIGWMIVKGLVGVLVDLFGEVAGGTGGFLEFVAVIAGWLYQLRNAIKEGEGLTKFFEGLSAVLKVPVKFIMSLGAAIGGMFKDLSGADFSSVGDAVGKLTDRLNPLAGLGDKVATAWAWVTRKFEGFVDFLRPLGESLGRIFSGIGEAIGESFRTLDFNGIMDIFNTGLLAGLVLMVRKFFKGGFKKEVEDGGGGIVASIKEIFGGVTDTLDAMQTTLKAGTLVMIAGAIALLTASVLTLSLIDSGKLTSALIALGVMFTQLMIAMLVFDKIAVGSSVIKMNLLAAAMVPLSVAILILSAAVKSMADLDWNELAKGLTGVVVLLGALAGTAKLMQGKAAGIMTTALAMIPLALAIKLLVGAVEDLADLGWEELAKGLSGVAVLLVALGLFSKFGSANKAGIASGAGIILLATGIKIMSSAVGDFADMDVPKMIQGLAAVTAVLGVLAGFGALTKGSKGMLGTAAAMVVLGGALKIMASALSDFADLSWDELVRGFVGMGGALVLITGAMLLMPPNMILTATGLVVVAGALKIIASAMQDFGGMTWDEIGRGLVVLAGSLAILAGAMALMGIPLVLLGSIGIIAAAGALAILAPAMVALGGMEWDEIGRGLTMLASTLGILALAGILILPAIPGLVLLGGAITLIGAGTLLAGVGVLAFATALGLLTVAGAAGTATMVAMGSALIGLIPEALTALAQGIIDFIMTLANAAPEFLKAATTLFLTLLQAVNTLAPQIIDTLWTLIWMLVAKIIEGVPRFVNAGMQLLTGLLNGIADRMPELIDAGTRVIVSFLDGISRNLPDITNAGTNLIITFVESLAASIRNNNDRMRSAGGELAMAIADGMTFGLASKVEGIAQGAAELGRRAIQAAKAALDSNSPSKKFIQIGKDTALGMQIGITKNAEGVAGAASRMGKTTIGVVKNSVAKIGDMLKGDMDFNPTITPVLDLSQLERDSKRIGSMLPGDSLNVGASMSMAAQLQDETDERGDDSRPDGGDDEPKGGVINFNQYNNSPKALSKADIYRQTKNQLSVVKKGALVKS